jgi:hypothetical protein
MFNKIIIVIGPKRTGKTRLTSKLASDIDRCVTFDIMKDAQYTTTATVVRGKPAELARSIGPDKQKFNVVYQPTIIKVKENGLLDAPEFEPILKLCHLRGDMWFIIDEAHLLCNYRTCPAELVMASYVGGHSGFSMILIAQSFSGIHPIVRRNADEFYLWKLIEPGDIEAVEDRCGKEVGIQVQQLRATEISDDNQFKSAGQMLHWTKSKGVVEVTE